MRARSADSVSRGAAGLHRPTRNSSPLVQATRRFTSMAALPTSRASNALQAAMAHAPGRSDSKAFGTSVAPGQAREHGLAIAEDELGHHPDLAGRARGVTHLELHPASHDQSILQRLAAEVDCR